MTLTTPYYRSLTIIPAEGCADQSTSSYTPYDIFCLQTRLYPIVYQMLGRNVLLLFEDEYVNERMELVLKLVRVGSAQNFLGTMDHVKLKKKQQKILNEAIDKITAEHMGYCLIDKQELLLSVGKIYPTHWFYTMMEYVILPIEYNPFLSSARYSGNESDRGGIYLTFNPESDYKTAYNSVCKLLLDTIAKYYEEGVVYRPYSIIDSWSLEQVDTQTNRLYRPTWRDDRFAPNLVEFLLRKIQGDPYIRLPISSNLVTRHYIASILNEYEIAVIFEGDYARIQVNNLEEAQKIASLVTSVTGLGSDQKVVIRNLAGQVESFMNSIPPEINCISYQTSNIEKPYTVSCLVDLNSDFSFEN